MKSNLRLMRSRGFTLIELMVVVALVAIVLTLAAPSFRDMILMRRLHGVSAELVTDVQFARSEAVSRQQFAVVMFGNGATPAQSCYVIYACTNKNSTGCICDCTLGAGNACSPSAAVTEIRTVQVLDATGVQVRPIRDPLANSALMLSLEFDPVIAGMRPVYIGTGNLPYAPAGSDSVEALAIADPVTARRTLRDIISPAGRPSVCTPGGLVNGVPTCP